jgi:hypothetical protein
MPNAVCPNTAISKAYEAYVPGSFMLHARSYGGMPWSMSWPA